MVFAVVLAAGNSIRVTVLFLKTWIDNVHGNRILYIEVYCWQAYLPFKPNDLTYPKKIFWNYFLPQAERVE